MFTLGNILLCISIFFIIGGIPMAFSKTERERMQKRVMRESPERSVYTGSPEALRQAQWRGYITLAIGLVFLVIWFLVYGKIFV